jgi:cytoskeletal protein RodZ
MGRYTSAMKIIAPLLAAVLAWTATCACAQWQWIDKDGRKVFSDRSPPVEIQDKDIIKRPAARAPGIARATTESVDGNTDVTSAPAALASAPKVSTVDKELEAKKKQAADLELAKRRLEEERITKVKIENCARAKQAQVTLNSGIRLAQVNKAGEREVMNETTRAAEAKRIQAVIDSDCK